MMCTLFSQSQASIIGCYARLSDIGKNATGEAGVQNKQCVTSCWN